MIREVAVKLQANLRAKGCPIPVVVGPEPTGTATFGRERIVIEHSDSDGFQPAWSQSVNPKRRMTRLIGAKATIYAQSTKAGAQVFEHRRRCEQILDMVLCGLSNIQAVRNGKGAFLPSGGRFIVPDDLAASERPGGAAYELTFAVQRGVADVTWTGEAQPEAELDGGIDGVGILNSTRVSVNGSETYESIPEV
jgi:hypothetical protein